MVAELLRLKLRLLANGMRVPRTAAGALIGMVLAGAALLAFGIGATSLVTGALDELTVRRVVVVASLLLSLGAFVIPLIAVRTELIDPQALRGYGFRRAAIGGALLLVTLAGPAVLFIPLVFVPILSWTGDGRSLAWLAAPLLLIQCVLSARLGAALGARLRHHAIASAFVRLGGVTLLLAGLVVLAAHLAPWAGSLAPGSAWPTVLAVVLAAAPLRDPAIADAIIASPLGSLWRAPMDAEFGDAERAQQDVAVGVLLILVLTVLWGISVAVGLRATRRMSRTRAARVPGWFRRLPSSPAGAIAARSFTYWTRDPRYRVVLAMLPVVVGGMLTAMWVAGVPFESAALVPLPVALLLVSWSTLHNDVAYDSTAMWLHLAAQTRGTADRIGRLLPVLTLGSLIILIGAPLTVWGFGDGDVAPAVLGVSLAVLLGGVGVSCLISARFPYPATRPSDPPFLQPQVQGNSGGGIQFGSVLLIVLAATPALLPAALWLAGVPGPWNWVALALGLAVGFGVLAVGIKAGGAGFDRRAPELLAFTVRN